MKGTVYIVSPDHTDIKEVGIRHYSNPIPLTEMQEFVQGYIELVPGIQTCRPLLKSSNPCVAFCNESGRILNLPVNPIATRLWHEVAPYMNSQNLCGPVMFLTGNEKFMAAL
jgi:hypothetical protein